MSKRSQRNALYDSLPYPYQRNQVPYFGDDGAPSIAENRANRNAYVDSLNYPYQRDQTKEYSNVSGPPKGIEAKRDVRNAYYDNLPMPYQRYQPYVVQPNMPFPYYGQQQPEQVVLPNGDMGFVDPMGDVIDEGAPVIVPANLQSFSLLMQQGASGGETLAQEQQDFYSDNGWVVVNGQNVPAPGFVIVNGQPVPAPGYVVVNGKAVPAPQSSDDQDFYSNAAGKKTGKGKGCATRPGDEDCAEGYSNAAGKKTGKGCATRPGDEDCQNAEGPMDFVKSHAKLIGGVALTSVAAFTVWFVWIRK